LGGRFGGVFVNVSGRAWSPAAPVSVSVVSHGHGAMVRDLLLDLAHLASPWLGEVILTLNIPEEAGWVPPAVPYPLRVIENPQPRGFGANHNAAARLARGAVLAILNPDLRLDREPFGPLYAALMRPQIGLVAPCIVTDTGELAPSARRLYTPWEVVSRFWRTTVRVDRPDWLAGMFLMVRRETFAYLGGFDERYFLYVEDVDLCTRMRLAGWQLALLDQVRVRHAAQYASHRSWRHLRWHVTGMLRYWRSPGFWRLWWLRHRAG
jgi:N-acetylglucosaminyl-diphospho-decaprenol L-rhamnosyltransferase